MELRDFIVTPLLLIIVYVVAYIIRPWITDENTRVYFLPALALKIFGAIALGVLYQFYYESGDTFMYHTYGSRLVWEAFIDSPETGLKLLFTDGINQQDIYKYSSKIILFKDAQSYNIVRIASLFDLFTFSSYSATAVLFSLFSFTGMWMLFLTFYKQYYHLHRQLAIAALFIPSVAFWGSGILKDTITLACLGIATYYTYTIFLERKIRTIPVLMLFASLYAIYNIKIFILQAFIPATLVWILAKNFGSIRSVVLKIMLVPFTIAIMLFTGYYAIVKVGENSDRYSIDNIAKTAQVTAYDIRYWSGREAGSGYSLGELDGTFGSMIKLAPQAINVSLYRPYMWEVKNPLMLLSALESLFLLILTLYVLVKKGQGVISALSDPNIIFVLVFSISFAFAVGVSTFNFGTLARYKIPLLPFFTIALILILDYKKSERKLDEFEITE